MISLNHVVAHAFRWVPLPFIILYNLIISPFSWRTKDKRPKRIMLEAAIRWIGWCQLVMPLPPWKEPPSDESYKAWCLKRNVEEDVEELGLNAKLFWIGRKAGREGDSRVAPGKVILYFHGGAYVMGLNGAVIDYANYIRKEASKGLKGDKNEECIGLALLGYTLVPDAAFPTQLHQAILAVQSLLDKGINPSNVILMGDSAGGNLIAQLLGHMLHPMPAHTDIPKLPTIDPKVKFAGAFLQSPWANLAPEKEGILKGTWKTNLGHDILSRDSLAYAGEQVFEALHRNPSLLSTLYPYITFPAAPLDWWDRVDTKVGKVLISAGELEVMCDEIIEFGGCLGKVHRDVEVMVIKGGIHNDPTFDFLFEGEDEAKRASRKELKRIVEWTKGVFEHS